MSIIGTFDLSGYGINPAYCALEYNGSIFVGGRIAGSSGGAIVKINPLTGALLSSTTNPAGTGTLGFLSCVSIGNFAYFVTGEGIVFELDMDLSPISAAVAVLGQTAFSDSFYTNIASDATNIYVMHYNTTTNTLNALVQFPAPAPPAAPPIVSPFFAYSDRSPLPIIGKKIYYAGQQGEVVEFDANANTMATILTTPTGLKAMTKIGTSFVAGGEIVGGVDTHQMDLTFNALASTLLESPGSSHITTCTNDGTSVYFSATTPTPAVWKVSPSLTLQETYFLDPILANEDPRVILVTPNYMYVLVSDTYLTTYSFTVVPPTPEFILQPDTIPQIWENIHLPSGNDIVPYSAGAVVPPAIPSIPARRIQDIKLPNSPKDVACNTAARCHPTHVYKNVPEPTVQPANPGQQRICNLSPPAKQYGAPLQQYRPGYGTYTVTYNKPSGSRVASTWPPPSNK